MKFRFTIPHNFRLTLWSLYKSFLYHWFSFWKKWHYVKYYYYNSSRHLLKTKKYSRKVRRIRHEITNLQGGPMGELSGNITTKNG